MENKLISQSSELFKDIETFESFLELQKIFPKIEEFWKSKYLKELYNIKTPPSWKFKRKEKENGGVWFLSSEVKEEYSLGIWIENDQFSLWANQDHFNIVKIKELIKLDDFSPIKEQFKESDILIGRDSYILKEQGKFQFDSIPLESNLFMWAAGNYPQVIVNQLDEKLQNFFTPEITALFQKINDAARID